MRANLTHRAAFYTPTGMLSRMIIERNGAETLRVPGEMYYKAYGSLVRCDAVYIEDHEITEIVEEKQLAYPDINAESKQKRAEWIYRNLNQESDETDSGSGIWSEQRDELLVEAGRYVIEKNNASIGLLQRRFRIDFSRAAAIMDLLCKHGVVSITEGTNPRRVLMTREEFEEFMKKEMR